MVSSSQFSEISMPVGVGSLLTQVERIPSMLLGGWYWCRKAIANSSSFDSPFWWKSKAEPQKPPPKTGVGPRSEDQHWDSSQVPSSASVESRTAHRWSKLCASFDDTSQILPLIHKLIQIISYLESRCVEDRTARFNMHLAWQTTSVRNSAARCDWSGVATASE
jgi:hypothetical protein